MKFNKNIGCILHLGQSNTEHKLQIGRAVAGKQPCRKESEGAD